MTTRCADLDLDLDLYEVQPGHHAARLYVGEAVREMRAGQVRT